MSDGLTPGEDGRQRCSWNIDKPIFRAYHDDEWGRPVGDDRRIFEKICIEGFGAGLSFMTILRKREALRQAFDAFDIATVAAYDDVKIQSLMENAAIIRNRRKIESVIGNARRALDTRREFGSLAALLWSVEPVRANRPQRFDRKTLATLTESAESRRFSSMLKQRGWTYVGPTSLYAVMQSLGVVNDHLEGCDFRRECLEARARFVVPGS